MKSTNGNLPLLMVLSVVMGFSACEKQKPPPLKLAIQKLDSSVEKCLSHYGNHPVVMFVTARWGLQGAITEKLLEDPAVAEACMRYNAVVVVADMGSPGRNEERRALMESHGQAGLPYFAIYPADRSRSPFVGHSFFSADKIAADIDAALK